MRFSLPRLALLLVSTPGCGLLLDRSYPDVGSDAGQRPHDAGPDAPRTMDASFDASLDAGSEVEPDVGGDAPTVMDAGVDAPLDSRAIDTGREGDASFDVGRGDAGIWALCGNGVVEGGEACDLGRAGLFDPLSPCDSSCHIRPGWDCRLRSTTFPSELATERGESGTSSWTWSLIGMASQHAQVTDEETCIPYPPGVGYLHSVELGQPGQDGWISPASSGCGVVDSRPAGTYTVAFEREFSADGGTSFDLIIGADNVVSAVFLDGMDVGPVADLLGDLDGHFVPRYIVNIHIPPTASGPHRLRVLVQEFAEIDGIATGLSVNAWNPSVCTAVAPLP